MILARVFKTAPPDDWIYSHVCHTHRLYTAQCPAADSDIMWHKINHMPGLLLLLLLTSVMELLHWSITYKSKFMPVHNMQAYGGMKLQLCSFSTSVLDWGKWSASWPDWFTPRKEPPLTLNSMLGGLWEHKTLLSHLGIKQQFRCTKFNCAGNLAPTICAPLL